MKYALFGYGTVGKWTINAIKKNDAEFELCYISDNNCDLWGCQEGNIEVVSPELLAEYYKKQMIDAVIIAVDKNGKYINTVTKQLCSLGIDKLYILPVYFYNWDKGCFNVRESLISVDISKPWMEENLNLTIIRNCNLNCRRCEMYANLYKEPCYADFTKYEKDMHRLRELFWGAKRVCLFGGEPLLNEELCDYIVMSRKIFPDAFISVETNGILVPKCSDELLDTMNKYDAEFIITPYKISKKQEITIRDRCKLKNVHYEYRGDGVDEETGLRIQFFKRLDSTGKYDVEEAYDRCREIGAAFNWHLKDGYMSGCVMPLYIGKFNETYSNTFEVDEKDAISIYENIDGYSLMKFLSSAKPFCRYCVLNRPLFDWECGGIPKKSDWLVNEEEE